jgi:hypothetical protein
MGKDSRTPILSAFLSRIRKNGRRAEPTTRLRPFQAISIYRGTLACPMAHRFSEHRFLAKDAPPLPLSGCTMRESCECRYLKHKDRRGTPRRLIDFTSNPRVFSGHERRVLPGRRRSD